MEKLVSLKQIYELKDKELEKGISFSFSSNNIENWILEISLSKSFDFNHAFIKTYTVKIDSIINNNINFCKHFNFNDFYRLKKSLVDYLKKNWIKFSSELSNEEEFMLKNKIKEENLTITKWEIFNEIKENFSNIIFSKGNRFDLERNLKTIDYGDLYIDEDTSYFKFWIKSYKTISEIQISCDNEKITIFKQNNFSNFLIKYSTSFNKYLENEETVSFPQNKIGLNQFIWFLKEISKESKVVKLEADLEIEKEKLEELEEKNKKIKETKEKKNKIIENEKKEKTFDDNELYLINKTVDYADEFDYTIFSITDGKKLNKAISRIVWNITVSFWTNEEIELSKSELKELFNKKNVKKISKSEFKLLEKLDLACIDIVDCLLD